MAMPALLFDLDGTLVDSARDIARALSMLLNDRGASPIDVADVRPLVSKGASTLVRVGLGKAGRDPTGDLEEFRAILNSLEPDPSMVYAGAREALSSFADGGVKMAIVTNKPENLARTLLDALDLSSFFITVVGGDTTSFSKPDAMPLRCAIDAMDLHDEAVCLIGDSAVDALAARAAGVSFILFGGGYGLDECEQACVTARFDRFDSLHALIGTWSKTTRPCAANSR